MKRRMRAIALAVVTGGLMTAASGLFQKAAAADDVTFALDWIVNGAHAGYFVAQDKGYYDAAGLNVTINRGFGSGDTVKRVASKTATFGLADTGALITARANDKVPVSIVAMIYSNSALGLIYLKESGIKEPKDLEGRAVGRSAAGASVNLFPAFLDVNGVDRSKIREVIVDASTFLPLMMSRQVDAVLEQSINIGRFRKAAEAQGMSVAPMRYADYGLITYGNAIMVNDETKQSSGDVIRRFVEASLKGVAYAFANPDEAIAIMRKTNPEVDPEVGKEELLAIRELALTPDVREKGLGWMDAKKMTGTRDVVTKALGLKRTVPIEEIYSTAFLPKSPVLPAGQ